jgi:hypothetical protein
VRRLKREEGAVMIMVAGMLVVLLAMVGLAVDLGALYSERRELRTGADAASLAIAENCGRGFAPCTDGAAYATAAQYAGWNSADGTSGAEVTLIKTSESTGQVQVVTSAYDQESGLAGVRVPFMSALGLHRIGVTASATAIFDHPASGATLPLVVAAAEWPGQYGLGAADNITDFAWLEGGGCPTTLSAWTWQQGSESNEPRCSAQYLRQYVYDRDILVALYFDEDGNRYQVAGFGDFHVTGYKLSDDPQYIRGDDCGTAPCLRGYFDQKTVSSGTPGGFGFGIVLVKLID